VKVALLGDVHDDLVRFADCVAGAAAAGAGAVIQVGDFGFRDELLGPGRAWPRFPIPVLALCGNHEDHAFLHQAQRSGLAGRWAAHGLCYQARGSVTRLGGRYVAFLGGALHVDRPQVHGGNLISEQDVSSMLTACAVRPPDLISTHSCPAGIGIGMEGDPALALDAARNIHAAGFDAGPNHDCGEPALRRLWDGLTKKPAIWAYGHFHVSRQTVVQGTTFVVLPEAGHGPITAWNTVSNSLETLNPASR
jgi:hypothetical protein